AILGVELEALVACPARHEFGLAALPNVVVQVEDAFAYARRSNRCFDAICVDLYIAGRMSHGVLAGGFLRDIARLLTPSGTVTFNLWRSAALPDQLRRLSRHLNLLSQTMVDDNIVVRCARHHGPLAPGEA